MPTISASRPVASLATRTIFGHRPAPAVPLALLLAALLVAGCGSASLPGQTSGTRTTTASTSPWRILSSPTTATEFFDSPAMVSPSEGWAVGTDTFLHYVNGQWSSVSGPTAHYVLTSIAMVSPSDGWAEGTNTSTGDGNNSNLLLHYTGGQWKIVSGPITQGLTYDPFGKSIAILEVTYPCQRPFDPLFLCSPVRFSIPV